MDADISFEVLLAIFETDKAPAVPPLD